MATIQIADKPTLDVIKAMLASSGGVAGYPNVSVITINKDSSATINGRGKVTIPCGGIMYINSVDGVSWNKIVGGSTITTPLVVSFEKSIVIKCTSDNNRYNSVLVQLAN